MSSENMQRRILLAFAINPARPAMSVAELQFSIRLAPDDNKLFGDSLQALHLKGQVACARWRVGGVTVPVVTRAIIPPDIRVQGLSIRRTYGHAVCEAGDDSSNPPLQIPADFPQTSAPEREPA